jgi:hypothetical protein
MSDQPATRWPTFWPTFEAESPTLDLLRCVWEYDDSAPIPAHAYISSYVTVVDQPNGDHENMPLPLDNCFCPDCQHARRPNARPDSRYLVASRRNQQTRTVIEQFNMGRADHALYCADHSTTHYMSNIGERYRLAANPREWCSGCAHKPVGGGKAKPKGMNRRFGVEFEFIGLTEEEAKDALVAAGIDAHYWDGSGGWTVKDDGSVYDPTGRGGEISSPILKGERGLEEIRKVLAVLREHGAKVNDTCGMHVHLEADDLSMKQIAAFGRSYFDNHDLIDWLVTPDRRIAEEDSDDDYYINRLSERTIRRLEQPGMSKSGMYDGDRYRTVNFNSFAKFGTIEVRQHQGTLSFTAAENWIRFCQGLMDAVTKLDAPLAKSPGLKSFMDALPVDDDVKSYLIGRALTEGGLRDAAIVIA